MKYILYRIYCAHIDHIFNTSLLLMRVYTYVD